MNDKIKRMRELIEILNKAAYEYYQKNNEIMSNLEYDRLYDELQELEKETKTILSASPTQNVGYEVLSELPKREHDEPMLSLEKTKDISELKDWLGNQEAILSWKLDGLTIVLKYNEGKLVQAVTRGNGSIGEEITPNAKAFSNIPLSIGFKGELILRGEAVIKYSEFEKINERLPEDEQYKNPRNLCSGTVRQLNTAITKERNVCFYAFTLVRAEGVDFENSRENQFKWLETQGFDVVENVIVNADSLESTVESFEKKIQHFDIPSDGLVLLMSDIAYGESLGATSKFPRNAMAFKWTDETRETKLKYIEWSPSRTGLINPVAVFEPVELEGTTVSRASVHNVSIVEALKLGEGDTITVYKANMIIPQIAENLTKSGNVVIPSKCPACSFDTVIKNENDVKTLYCKNADCPVKHIKGFTLMVSRDALNIDGLSEMTLEKFLSAGFIKEKADIFKLSKYEEKIVKMEGFGRRSYDNMINAIEKSRNTTLPRFIYSLGIAGIGVSNAKLISKYFNYDFNAFKLASKEELLEIENIGEVLAESIVSFFRDEKNKIVVEDLYNEVTIEKVVVEEKAELKFSGKTFVITGKLEHFSNRKELEEIIEKNGGKVSSSISTKTNFLINNDKMSNSSKNKKAKELEIEIISENDFLQMLNND